MNTNREEIRLLDIQIITTVIYIGSLVLSIYLTYNDKLSLLNQKEIFTKKQMINYSVFNRKLVVILTAIYLYISYENNKIAKKNNRNIRATSLQLTASQLSFISTIIVLYVVIKTSGEEYSIISGAGNSNL